MWQISGLGLGQIYPNMWTAPFPCFVDPKCGIDPNANQYNSQDNADKWKLILKTDDLEELIGIDRHCPSEPDLLLAVFKQLLKF